MTEHPETPRIAYGDRRADPRATDPTVRPALPALEWNRPGWSGGRRRVILGAAGFAMTAGSGFLIWLAARGAANWLSSQTSYQIPFKDIQLVPPPPEWYRGGRQAFLESIRKQAGVSRTIPVLEKDLGQIKVMFQSPWVENVVLVTKPPLALRVELQYREPVALVSISGNETYVLDRSATILPWADIDWDRLKPLGPLVVIDGKHLSGPLDSRPGAIWKPKGGMTDIAEGNGRIPSAAKLAGFLVKKMRAAGPFLSPTLVIRQVDPTDGEGRGLFMWNAEDTWILWGEAPGEETPGNLVAEEKWDLLRLWCQRTANRRLKTTNEFWRISKGGVVHVGPEAKPSGQPKAR